MLLPKRQIEVLEDEKVRNLEWEWENKTPLIIKN